MTSKLFAAASFALPILTGIVLVLTIGRMQIASAFRRGINWNFQLQLSGKVHRKHRAVLACTLQAEKQLMCHGQGCYQQS
jgi:hypothetical protein